MCDTSGRQGGFWSARRKVTFKPSAINVRVKRCTKSDNKIPDALSTAGILTPFRTPIGLSHIRYTHAGTSISRKTLLAGWRCVDDAFCRRLSNRTKPGSGHQDEWRRLYWINGASLGQWGHES